MADRQDVPLAGLGATGCTLVVGAYCSSVRRKHSRGGNEATLPQEFSKPLPLAGVFCPHLASNKLNLISAARYLEQRQGQLLRDLIEQEGLMDFELAITCLEDKSKGFGLGLGFFKANLIC